MKKKTGGDSTSVSSTKRELVGGRKKSDNNTEYNKPKIHNTTKFTPDYPYGQQHLSKSMAKPGAGKAMNSKAVATSTKKK